MPDDHGIDGQWERVAAELRACREAQQQAWGDVDNTTLGRYLADDVTPAERRRIEAALQERPELRKLTDLVSDVLGDCQPVFASEAAARPAVLPFRQTTAPPKATSRRWRQWAAVAAAAALLFILGYTVLPRVGQSTSSMPGGDVAARSDHDLDRIGAMAIHLPPSAAAPSDHPTANVLADADDAKGKISPAGAAGAANASELSIPDPVFLACADGLNWAGERLQKAGDLDNAEWSYHLAHKIRAWKLGPDAPPTIETRQRLGDVYQVALNMPEANPYSYTSKVAIPTVSMPPMEIQRPATDDPAKYALAKKEEQFKNSANQLRERITKQTPAEVRKSVVPILVQDLRDAQTPLAREQLGRALAELGPAANDAIPVLEDCLAKAKSPEERAVVLRALGEMGPAAGANAAPVLVTSLKSPSPVERRAAEDALLQYGVAARDAFNQVKNGDASPAARAEWENVKSRVLGAEGRVGVHDAGERFSPLALKVSRRALRELARDYNVQVFAETEGPSTLDEEKSAKDRVGELGVNGLSIVIRRSPIRVEVYVGPSLREQGFDEKQQERLRQVVEAEVSRQDYDQGLLEGVRFLARFQAERARKAGPEAAPSKP